MKNQYKKVTFRSISGNRYRCNQTGVIVPASKTESYSAMLLNVGRSIPKETDVQKQTKKLPSNFNVVVKSKKTKEVKDYGRIVDSNTTVICHECRKYNLKVGAASGIYQCPNGHKVNMTVSISNNWKGFHSWL